MEPPGDVDRALEEHVRRVREARPGIDPAVRVRLDAALARVRGIAVSRERIALESSVPGGVLAKKLVGRLVRPQIDGVLAQLAEQHDALQELAAVLVETADALVRDLEGVVVQQLDDLQVRVAEQRRALNTRELRES